MQLVPILIGAFILVPFIEIYLLLTLGAVIGPLPTVALVIGTAITGAWLLRRQGFATLNRLRAQLDQGVLPAFELIEGPLLLVGGALLLTPGFVTDGFGFALLVPAIRRKLAQYILTQGWLITTASPESKANGQVLEGEFRKEDKDA